AGGPVRDHVWPRRHPAGPGRPPHVLPIHDQIASSRAGDAEGAGLALEGDVHRQLLAVGDVKLGSPRHEEVSIAADDVVARHQRWVRTTTAWPTGPPGSSTTIPFKTGLRCRTRTRGGSSTWSGRNPSGLKSSWWPSARWPAVSSQEPDSPTLAAPSTRGPE